MSFWLREIFGWLLLVSGLVLIYECFLLIQERRIWETGPLSVIAIVVFRGGIHLLKVAVAARICAQARQRTQPEQSSSVQRVVRSPARAVVSVPQIARGS